MGWIKHVQTIAVVVLTYWFFFMDSGYTLWSVGQNKQSAWASGTFDHTVVDEGDGYLKVGYHSDTFEDNNLTRITTVWSAISGTDSYGVSNGELNTSDGSWGGLYRRITPSINFTVSAK